MIRELKIHLFFHLFALIFSVNSKTRAKNFKLMKIRLKLKLITMKYGHLIKIYVRLVMD
jgi:hypothetical protein